VIYECVINVSEGRDTAVLSELAGAASPLLLDTHRDPDHHRAVFTLAGPPDDLAGAARSLAEAAVARIDLTGHGGAHPRFGVLDVVPFTPYLTGAPPPTELGGAVALRDDFARWLGTQLGVPTFRYGPHSGLPGQPDRTLPQLRAHAFADQPPDFGPPRPHRTAGATAVGARPVLIAYNVWVSSEEVARLVAPRVRGPRVRALGLALGDRAQVSCNLIDPAVYGPARLYDDVAALTEANGGAVLGAELVGLLPEATLRAIPPARWPELGLSEGVTVEARLDLLLR
jgi:glutamate formiminotransferase / 5-formyltetrahydrofolate cyclo-ligase